MESIKEYIFDMFFNSDIPIIDKLIQLYINANPGCFGKFYLTMINEESKVSLILKHFSQGYTIQIPNSEYNLVLNISFTKDDLENTETFIFAALNKFILEKRKYDNKDNKNTKDNKCNNQKDNDCNTSSSTEDDSDEEEYLHKNEPNNNLNNLLSEDEDDEQDFKRKQIKLTRPVDLKRLMLNTLKILSDDIERETSLTLLKEDVNSILSNIVSKM